VLKISVEVEGAALSYGNEPECEERDKGEIQMLKVPQWIQRAEMTRWRTITVPPIATLPPLGHSADDRVRCWCSAPLTLRTIKAPVGRRQSDWRVCSAARAINGKSDFSKGNAQLRLDIAMSPAHLNITSAVEDHRRFANIEDMNDKTRQVFDRFGVKGTAKERKPNRERRRRRSTGWTVG
jgi:hypothetical protein